MLFRFQSKKVHLTYSTHLNFESYKATILGKLPGGPENLKMFSFVHEQGDTDEESTPRTTIRTCSSRRRLPWTRKTAVTSTSTRGRDQRGHSPKPQAQQVHCLGTHHCHGVPGSARRRWRWHSRLGARADPAVVRVLYARRRRRAAVFGPLVVEARFELAPRTVQVNLSSGIWSGGVRVYSYQKHASAL